MYIGHYAAALGIASFRPRRGVLTYLAFAASLPDLLMLGMGTLGSRWNYHSDAGLLVCVALVVLPGLALRAGLRTVGLALGCLATHLVLDIPYAAGDPANLYGRPLLDFGIESALLVVAGGIFLIRSRPSHTRRMYFIAMLAALLLLQLAWDLIAGSYPA